MFYLHLFLHLFHNLHLGSKLVLAVLEALLVHAVQEALLVLERLHRV